MVLTMYEEHADICAAIGEERVRDEIDRGIKRAVGYAIFDEGDVESFLHMLFERGFDFDSQNPWCKRLLNNKKLKGSAKMGLLDELLN
jgi:hypothetical protein